MRDKFGRARDAFGRWMFLPTIASRPFRRVGRGIAGDPIYPVLGERGACACLKYYEDALRFLRGEADEPPSLEAVRSAAIPHGPIFELSLQDSEATPDVFGPKVYVWIEDADRMEELFDRSPRWLDPEYVPVLLLLVAAGGSLRFNDSTSRKDKNGVATPPEKRRFFLAFGRGAEQNIRLLRIIADAPEGSQVHRRTQKSDPNFHYDHRKNCLEFKSDDSVIQSGRPAGYSGKGREAAIEAAGEHFERAAERHGPPALRHIADSPASFRELLGRCFEIADRLHAEQTRRRKLVR